MSDIRPVWRALLAFSHDVIAVALAWYLAFLFRFNLDVPAAYWQSLLRGLPVIIAVHALVFWRAGLYRGLWRYASLPDIQRMCVAVAIGALAIPFLALLLRPSPLYPRSTFLLAPILLFGIMCASRIGYRAWKERSLSRLTHLRGDPVIILGAGEAAARLIKDLLRSPDWRVVGMLDDDPGKRGRMVLDVPVLGRLDELGRWSLRLSVNCVIIAMPSATGKERRRALNLCYAAGVRALTVPSLEDLMSGRVATWQLRPIQVSDLLGRPQVELKDSHLATFFGARVVMVTGAGGSIGSELCRQIAAYKPGLLVLLDSSEFSLYQIREEFADLMPAVPVVATIGNVKNRVRLREVMARYRPSVVFHAAAYKHVPLMEEDNAWEAVRNNVLGTYLLARAAIEHGVRTFVLVSTDKAVRPTSVMGATKRLAEMICQRMQGTGPTQFKIVRFGNVIGSAGSVIPKFHEQIARGGPVTVTHPDMIRYFMSIPEAAQLLLHAGCIGQGGEVFVMDMGEPVKIANLAREMIRLAGLGEEEIKVVFTGLRPGERLCEELLTDSEKTGPSEHPKLRIAKAAEVASLDLDALTHWLEQTRPLSDDEVRRDLKRWVPEYQAQRPQLRVVASSTAASGGD